ncbi:hypothetical protein [uncultured Thiodictyon sp.]|jgi:hypothetical protein|uniref:hypothetical protein n=1 Tax=uncultured Thiodictyon sp. TaxID=1846217 RepID=UPI0025E75069|nr:hypothetical protein [uncultured Thiodictyon sp.]
MAARSRSRAKGRSEGGSFAALPHALFRAQGDEPPPVARLSKLARLLLIDIAMQYRGGNNGNLSAAPKILEPYGWCSRGSIDKAISELVNEGFLQLTRQGGRNRCSLYALTWHGIDEGPHDEKPNPVSSALWKPENAQLRQLRRPAQNTNASRVADKRSRVADKSAFREGEK